MLVSETQASCFGVDIDSKSRCFGCRGSIILDDDTNIPLRLEHALMTCPIRLVPTAEELDTLQVHWLTANAPCFPIPLQIRLTLPSWSPLANIPPPWVPWIYWIWTWILPISDSLIPWEL